MEEQFEFIEREIVVGAIVSDEYMRLVAPYLDLKFFQSSTARLVIRWCKEFYFQYGKAIGVVIEEKYYAQLDSGKISKDTAENIEEFVLPEIAALIDTGKQDVDVQYLFTRTVDYFKLRAVELHEDELKDLRKKGDLVGLQKAVQEFVLPTFEQETNIKQLDTGHEEVLEHLKKAFEKSNQNLIRYPGALGQLLNNQLIRGAFVAFMAPEKRGKTFFLLDLVMRGTRQGKKVAFFQAGDMTEEQQLRRIAIYLSGKSDVEQYVGKQNIPVKDCIYNQLGMCDRKVRTCDVPLFDGLYTETNLRDEVTFDAIIAKRKQNPDYVVCRDCVEYTKNNWATVWLEEKDLGQPLTYDEAKKQYEKFFLKHKKGFKLITYPNGELSLKELKRQLSEWKSKEKYIPDIIVIDYADLLVCYKQKEFRQQQNEIWKQLRGISQQYDCLLVTATQTDANAYKNDTITLSNYSEDKRKYAHVTAMYGLSQDSKGREKRLGIVRVNELLVRDGGLDNIKQVYVLQSLKQGKAVLTSYI